MGKNDRKRVYSEFARKGASAGGAAPSPTGVASTLADLRTHQAGSDGWTAVSRSKKNKKGSDTCSESTADRGDRRPDLTYSNLHELQSFVKIADLQSLVLYCLAHGVGPRWISVKRHEHINKAVVIMVPGLEEGMFNGCIDLESRDAVPEQVTEEAGQDAVNPKAGEQNRDACRSTTDRSPDDYMPVILDGSKLSSSLKPLASIFKHLWPVKAPGDDRYFKVHSPLHAMLTCPIPKNQEEKWAERHTRGPIPVRDAPEWKDERTPITALLASREDLEENEYVLHPVYFTDEKGTDEQLARRAAAKATKDFGWIDSAVGDIEEGVVPDKEVEQGSITAGRTVLAMDCEMCIVEGGETALTRISIVGWDGEVVMDELVKPDKPIVDYLTQYSGITASALELVTTTLADIQSRLLSILTPRAIVVGHSLNSDLDALKMTHPYIVDTSIVFQHPRGPPLKSSLKWLSQRYIGREIQKGHGSTGHDSIEDAKACLDLVRKKCEKGLKWATAEVTSESIFKRLDRVPKKGSASQHANKKGAIIDHGHPERNFGTMASFCLGCKDDEDVVAGVKRAVLGDEDGAVIPGGGVEFTWARLRELETLRGWSNNNRQSLCPNNGEQPGAARNGPAPAVLDAAVARTIGHIVAIREFLPPCTLLIVYSGTGDPREMVRMQEMQRTFREEYKVKKWDELSVKWTDTEEQALRRGCAVARRGVGFICVA